MKPLSICIAPLDWGLGHATRCIPIIKSFMSLGHKVYIASEGHHAVILKEALPSAIFLPLRGYRVRYAKNEALFFITILFQGPKILWSAINEYFWLKKWQKEFQFDLIVSDNRVGFFHKNVPSVFITHQLHLIMPYKWATQLFQQMQYLWLKNFSSCWVPDMEGANNLSGILSNPKQKPSTPVFYLGILSRLFLAVSENAHVDETKSIHFLGIISGPEPQRTLLENILWEQGNQLNKKFVLVAGLPMNKGHERTSANGTLYNHLSGEALANEINNAEYIICRGGYTSLMELIPFGKKLIFIPTPGQTEQIYLGQYWQHKNWALSFNQEGFNLANALDTAAKLTYNKPPFIPFTTDTLKNALKQLSL
jgi:hypothetical protein